MFCTFNFKLIIYFIPFFLQIDQLVEEGFFESIDNVGPYEHETAHAIFKMLNWKLNSTEPRNWPKFDFVLQIVFIVLLFF